MYLKEKMGEINSVSWLCDKKMDCWIRKISSELTTFMCLLYRNSRSLNRLET